MVMNCDFFFQSNTCTRNLLERVMDKRAIQKCRIKKRKWLHMYNTRRISLALHFFNISMVTIRSSSVDVESQKRSAMFFFPFFFFFLWVSRSTLYSRGSYSRKPQFVYVILISSSTDFLNISSTKKQRLARDPL